MNVKTNSRRNHVVFGLVLLLYLAWTLVLHAQLPDRVATKFAGNGVAAGWMAKTSHTALMLLVPTSIAGMLLVVGLLISVIPPSLINVPNPAYWKRKENLPTMRALFRPFFVDMGFYLLLFFGALQWWIVQANRRQPPRMSDSFWGVLAIFIVMIAVWTFRLFLAFRIPNEDRHEASNAIPFHEERRETFSFE